MARVCASTCQKLVVGGEPSIRLSDSVVSGASNGCCVTMSTDGQVAGRDHSGRSHGDGDGRRESENSLVMHTIKQTTAHDDTGAQWFTPASYHIRSTCKCRAQVRSLSASVDVHLPSRPSHPHTTHRRRARSDLHATQAQPAREGGWRAHSRQRLATGFSKGEAR